MIRLHKFDAARFRAYRSELIRDYAGDKVKAGVWSESEALHRSESDIDGLLPDGPSTDGHFLYTVEDEADEVGIVWFALRESGVGRSVWIYDILVHEAFRRKGYGKQILEAVEEEAAKLGANEVGLHVFGHNHGAWALYEKVGYEMTDIIMSKRLDE